MTSSSRNQGKSSEGQDSAEAVLPWVAGGRAFGGAIIFSLPLMMTMEMWWLGFYVDPVRLIVLILLSLPLFFGLARIVGFRGSKNWFDDIVDVFVAYAVGLLASAVVLVTLGVVDSMTRFEDAVTKIMLQAVPATLGALLARSVVGREDTSANDDPEAQDYSDELAILATGAIFLAFNLAPTEEMILLAYEMTSWHTLGLLFLTILIMHCFTNATSERSNADLKKPKTQWEIFVRFTCLGYVFALVISIFMLWVFSRTDNESFELIFTAGVVLGFPAGLGASASRLIL